MHASMPEHALNRAVCAANVRTKSAGHPTGSFASEILQGSDEGTTKRVFSLVVVG